MQTFKIGKDCLCSLPDYHGKSLFLVPERGPSISHILVLPPHPSTIAAMTPIDVTAGVTFEDLIKETGNDDTDPLLAGIVGDDVFKVSTCIIHVHVCFSLLLFVFTSDQ